MNENNQGENIADYVNENKEVKYTPKQNKFKQKIAGLYEGTRNFASSLYRGFFKASTVVGATTAFCANYSTINNLVEKYTGSEDIIFNVGLNDVAMGGLAVSTVLIPYLIVRKYNPLEKLVKGVLKHTAGILVGGTIQAINPKSKSLEKVYPKWFYNLYINSYNSGIKKSINDAEKIKKKNENNVKKGEKISEKSRKKIENLNQIIEKQESKIIG